ncbi:MAG TPA: hypothetical protein VGL58_18660 [Caulobacteraceae bacterium]|jgi:hypothetical protein
MPSRPTRKQIEAEDASMSRRQANFRLAADAVADALSGFEEVQAIALFGSVSRPLWREVPRFQPYRRVGIEVLHECKDVDLAVWLDRADRLAEMGRARAHGLNDLLARDRVGVAHHELDIFFFAAGGDRYLGRLCHFATCPKGKAECLVPGCGATPLLRQHEDFVMYADALLGSVKLYERRAGRVARAAEIGMA